MIAAIILAGGCSSRMGKNKLLVKLRGKEVLLHTVDTVLKSQVQRTIVVTGYQSEKIKNLLQGLPLTVVHNPYFQQGQSTSLKAGINKLEQSVEGVVFVLGDQPLLTYRTLNILIKNFKCSDNYSIFVPYYENKNGNPVIFHRRYLKEMMKIEGDRGARFLIKKYKKEVLKVPVDDIGVIADIDREEDINLAEKILKKRESNHNEPSIPSNYQGGLTRAFNKFSNSDPMDMALRTGVVFSKEKNFFLVKYCNLNYTVTYPEGNVLNDKGEEVPVDERMLLLLFLSEGSGLPLRNRWLSFIELPFGSHHAAPFEKEAEVPLARAFGSCPSDLLRISRDLGGEELGLGDSGAVIPVLPKVSLAVVLWSGGEGFPSKAKILFDSVCTTSFDTATLYMLGINVAKKLLQLKNK